MCHVSIGYPRDTVVMSWSIFLQCIKLECLLASWAKFVCRFMYYALKKRVLELEVEKEYLDKNLTGEKRVKELWVKIMISLKILVKQVFQIFYQHFRYWYSLFTNTDVQANICKYWNIIDRQWVVVFQHGKVSFGKKISSCTMHVYPRYEIPGNFSGWETTVLPQRWDDREKTNSMTYTYIIKE